MNSPSTHIEPTHEQTVTPRTTTTMKVMVATTVMLSFISFWRAAAIVLNDLGSSAFYAGGIAEQAIGPSAPWFILAVMLFSYAVRSVYIESCTLFTRGGVYRVVKEAMGSTLGKISVSALMFDYLLTGPISSVSAGQYCVGLIREILSTFHHPWNPTSGMSNLLSAAIAILITLYFWRKNIRGIRESSQASLKIMYAATAMIAVLILWSVITLITHPEMQRLPPLPKPQNLLLSLDAIGWLKDWLPSQWIPHPESLPSTVLQASHLSTLSASEIHLSPQLRVTPQSGGWMGSLGILIALGHSFLAMSGEESLAQVNRELEYPKHKNLVRAGSVIFIYSLIFTSMVSFLAYAMIPDSERALLADNLVRGIATHLIGPPALKLTFQALIVLVGSLMLSGAVNTAIIGSHGVLHRLSEDRILPEWFLKPHPRFGTSSRMIHLIAGLQLLIILASLGNIYTLGEAYAFGVIWSFTLKSLGMFLLRFKNPSPRVWKVPLNLKLGRLEIPLGLGIITLILFLIALINLITKEVATVSGALFTLLFFLAFSISEKLNRAKSEKKSPATDAFQVTPCQEITSQNLAIRPGGVLCLVRDYRTLDHLKSALSQVDTQARDFIVMTIRLLTGADTGYEDLNTSDLFTDYEQTLLTQVVSIAETAGKHVELLIVPSSQIFQAMVMAASQLQATEIIVGKSAVLSPDLQARLIGEAWESLPEKSRTPMAVHVVDPNGETRIYTLGAHAPTLDTHDIQLIHQLWLELIREPGYEEIHHKDVVTFALNQLKINLHQTNRGEILSQLRTESNGSQPPHHLKNSIKHSRSPNSETFTSNSV